MHLPKGSMQELKGSEWEELYDHHREISKATGARKPSESQKSKSSLEMKAAKDKGEEFRDAERKDNINETRLEVWREHLKDPIVALDKALKCVEFRCQN